MNNGVFLFKQFTCQHQIASLLFLRKQGYFFDLFFQEQLNKKNINEDKFDLLSCCYSYFYKKSYYITKKYIYMLSFNPILSQSRYTQILKIF